MKPVSLFEIPIDLLSREQVDSLSPAELLAIDIATRHAQEQEHYGAILGPTYIYPGHSATDGVCNVCGKTPNSMVGDKPAEMTHREHMDRICFGQAAYVVSLAYENNDRGRISSALTLVGVPVEGKPKVWAD